MASRLVEYRLDAVMDATEINRHREQHIAELLCHDCRTFNRRARLPACSREHAIPVSTDLLSNSAISEFLAISAEISEDAFAEGAP